MNRKMWQMLFEIVSALNQCTQNRGNMMGWVSENVCKDASEMVGATFLITLLSGCGNTISGIGKDISHVGDKVTAWQNEKPTEKVVEKKASK